MDTTQTSSKSNLMIKGLIIGGLALLLLIPTFFVQNLIDERESRQREAIAEVSSKWASQQIIAGPIVVLPFWEYVTEQNGKTSRYKRQAYFLPDQLNIQTSITPQEKYRGIYKVMLYSSQNNISGSFNNIDIAKLAVDPNNVLWNEAQIIISLTDSKGLNEELKLLWNGKQLELSPSTANDRYFRNAFSAPLNLKGQEEMSAIQFSSRISLNGSEQLLFQPLGKSTSVKVNSKWPHPSFQGNILPQATQVKDTGFIATWTSLSHRRNYPQQWLDGSELETQTSAFGVDLFVPVNGYQKTMRSVKYAILCILLTFAAFFLIEVVNNKSVHPFQYGLIGLALIVFYTLLLSFSEYISFNASYIIASVATIGLITWFVKGILASTALSAILSGVLVLMYTYVFTILQLQDYALILGSIGLFITLAIVMYFSKNIQWSNSKLSLNEI